MRITRFASYDLWFYGGIAIICIAVLLFAVQIVFYYIKKAKIHQQLDEEYGQPQKYHSKE